MTNLGCEVLEKLSGRTLSTAESLTGGAIGTVLTAIPGSSLIYKGGVISYTDEAKHTLLGVDSQLLLEKGAVSAPVAEAMAEGIRSVLHTDVAVSVTGLAGPGGDDYGNPLGTVFIGYSDSSQTISRQFLFQGNRGAIRQQTVMEALRMILTYA